MLLGAVVKAEGFLLCPAKLIAADARGARSLQRPKKPGPERLTKRKSLKWPGLQRRVLSVVGEPEELAGKVSSPDSPPCIQRRALATRTVVAELRPSAESDAEPVAVARRRALGCSAAQAEAELAGNEPCARYLRRSLPVGSTRTPRARAAPVVSTLRRGAPCRVVLDPGLRVVIYLGRLKVKSRIGSVEGQEAEHLPVIGCLAVRPAEPAAARHLRLIESARRRCPGREKLARLSMTDSRTGWYSWPQSRQK